MSGAAWKSAYLCFFCCTLRGRERGSVYSLLECVLFLFFLSPVKYCILTISCTDTTVPQGEQHRDGCLGY